MLEKHGSQRWIDFRAKCTFDYNNQWHQATNNKTFKIFKGRNGIFADKINLNEMLILEREDVLETNEKDN